jgi:hypothetical protein
MKDFTRFKSGSLLLFQGTGNMALIIEVDQEKRYVVILYLSKGLSDEYNDIFEGQRLTLTFHEIAPFEVL